MKLLAIETATEACSAALFVDNDVIERYRLAPREHNRLILPMAESLLADAGLVLAQLDGIAFGCGPGSFTGVRIATGVAQGLAFGAHLPVAPVSTLAAMAAEAFAETAADIAFPCIDARMGEVYWSVYRRTGVAEPDLMGIETVCAPAAVVSSETGIGIGSGWDSYREILSQQLGAAPVGVLPNRFPRAAWIARIGAGLVARGRGVDASDAQPAYVRNKVARKLDGSW